MNWQWWLSVLIVMSPPLVVSALLGRAFYRAIMRHSNPREDGAE